MKIKNIKRPSQQLIEKLKKIGTATASQELNSLGIKDPFIQGPISYTPGKIIAGPAITLQFLPIREDIFKDDKEIWNEDIQFHRHALYSAQKGDIVVVDARGDMRSGIFGEMMLTYFEGKGGEGIIVDGVIRDYVNAKKLSIGMWLKGVTPNYHTQVGIFPNAVNIPISCGGVLVNPGDIILADDDGAIVIPISLAENLSEIASGHAKWEIFAREKLSKGSDLKTTYPRKVWNKETENEFQIWLKNI